MKLYSQNLFVAFFAFIIGICAVWIWLSKPKQQHTEIVPLNESSIDNLIYKNDFQSLRSEPKPLLKPESEELKPVSIKKLQPSSKFWGQNFKILRQVSRISKNRKLAAVGDMLYMLDARNRIIWTWTTDGAPLTDFPVIDSEGIIYVIAYDLTWVSLNSESGEKLSEGTACGRAVYSQIELYKKDMYFVVTDMSGYRENDLPGEETNDDLLLARGNRMLWETKIPSGAKIKFRKSKVFVTFKRKKQTVTQEIKIPKNIDNEIGEVILREIINSN